ncbi:MAG: hypothetical protein DCF22_16210 [Leptolyngbya sp.]|nr:MAG: hypothetical protein DCF22_16210 [Leptolyngbya sp.]
MPELTPQDRESYQKLYDAAKTLFEKIPNASGSNTLKELTSAFFSKLPESKDLSSFEQLQSQVELTGGYLTMYQLFAAAIESIKGNAANETKAAINEASQKLSIQYNQLKVSLEAVDNDFLEDLTTPSSDPLFLGLLADSRDPNVKNWTQQILSDRSPVLTDNQVQNLTDAWGIAVTAFIEDARKQGEKVAPGESKTIAHFFCIHDQLDGLYSELSTAVALNS